MGKNRGRNYFKDTAGNDVFVGTDLNDQFFDGLGGDDTFNGGAGNDRFYFSSTFDEADRVIGGDGYDRLYLSGTSEVATRINTQNASSIEEIQVTRGRVNFLIIEDGFGDLTIRTGFNSGAIAQVDASSLTTGSLKIYGGTQADHLIGGEGDDRIIGLPGGDLLTGGGGNDKFVYERVSDSSNQFRRKPDLITDFSEGDTIDLPTGLVPRYHVGQTDQRVGDVLVEYFAESNQTRVSVFIDSDDVADMTIDLSGRHTDLIVTGQAHLVIG
jgi:Ca2+-binding RTX toxin-like protein